MIKKRIGIIGFGGICNGAHLPGYEKSTDIAQITAVCDTDPNKLKQAKEKLNLSDDCLFADYKELIKSGLVDAIDICTPNDVHCKIAEAAIEAGIDFSVEKPIGLNYDETKALLDKANNSSSKSFVCFSYRYMAPFRYMRDIVKSGKIGKIRHVYMTYLKESGLWKGRRLEWRFDKERAGSGVLGDLGVHMIDAVRFLGEEFEGVFAQTGICIKERQALDSDEYLPVTTDDWCNLNARTTSGANVTMRISRVATNVKDFVEFEVIGEKGRMVYGAGVDAQGRISAEQKLRVSIGDDAPLEVAEVPEEYETIQSREFVKMLSGEEDNLVAHLDQGIECQKILEAAIKSEENGRYIKITEFE